MPAISNHPVAPGMANTTVGKRFDPTGKTRRRGVIFCRHGCGFAYNSMQDGKKATDRRQRDQFDYHEQQQCPLLPRLVCPLECRYRGKLLSFAGRKALRQHFRTKSHMQQQQLIRQPVDISEQKLEADFDPESVHGNPRINKGLRKTPVRGEAEAMPKRARTAPTAPTLMTTRRRATTTTHQEEEEEETKVKEEERKEEKLRNEHDEEEEEDACQQRHFEHEHLWTNEDVEFMRQGLTIKKQINTRLLVMKYLGQMRVRNPIAVVRPMVSEVPVAEPVPYDLDFRTTRFF